MKNIRQRFEDDMDERLETFESIRLSMERENERTDRLKKEFANTIKYEYGDELKNNPNGAKLVNQDFWSKLKKSVIKFFELF